MSNPVVRLVAIRESSITVDEVLAVLDDDAAGGVNVFIGRVRDHDGGRGVSGLDYTAHPLALEQLRAVCEGVAARHDVDGVAAVHRTGSLRIGDLAVVVATSAAHRATAFEATRDLIDTLKSTVAIWKHQLLADGGEEWVGTP